MAFDPITSWQRDHPASSGQAAFGEHGLDDVARYVAAARSSRSRSRGSGRWLQILRRVPVVGRSHWVRVTANAQVVQSR